MNQFKKSRDLVIIRKTGLAVHNGQVCPSMYGVAYILSLRHFHFADHYRDAMGGKVAMAVSLYPNQLLSLS